MAVTKGAFGEATNEGLRCVFNDYTSSCESPLTRAGFTVPEIRRWRSVDIMAYRTIHERAPACLSDLLAVNEAV